MTYEKERRELLGDLYLVGIDKAVGYLPLEELVDFCQVSLEEIEEFARENHLRLLLFQPHETTIETGAVFIYHDDMLKDLLDTFAAELKKAGIPYQNPKEYISTIAKKHITKEEFPGAYRAIAKTFNDARYR